MFEVKSIEMKEKNIERPANKEKILSGSEWCTQELGMMRPKLGFKIMRLLTSVPEMYDLS